MTTPSPDTRWRRSSRSGAGNDCVELASSRHHIRDSKNQNAVLHVSNAARQLLNLARLHRKPRR
jgi:hypothetical protein